MSEILLPKTFIDRSPDGKYSHLNGLPKISYSQVNSWKDPTYRPDYIKQYFLGINIPSGIFADFGSSVGTYIEGVGTNNMDCHKEYEHLLCEEDRQYLNGIPYPENSIYEDYIVVNMGDYCIEGFADRGIYLPKKRVIVEDFKTGSVSKKKDYYASSDYMQTNLYSYQKEEEGYTIEDCRVILLDRAGNNSAKSPIRLTGKKEVVPTPYDRAKTELFLEQVTDTVKEISDFYKKYIKMFT
jgi:hypothetical protein